MPPPTAATADSPPAILRPRFRGQIHRYAAITFPLAVLAVVVVAPDGAARGWLAVYGACVTAMLAVSATYHSGRLGPAALRVLKRIDHSTILLAIAGSYTAIGGLSLTGTPRLVLLAVVWVGAAVGIGVRNFWLDAPRALTSLVYLVVGWAIVVELPAFLRGTTGAELALVVVGGLLYSAGGIVYARKRPDPWPATFGYHEVFHALVVLAACCHLGAVALLIAGR